MYQPGWLFITQLACLGAPLLYVVCVRPFEDWLKNAASAAVYCASIVAIVAPVCPKDVQAPLGYTMVVLMAFFCVAIIGVMVIRTIVERYRGEAPKQGYAGWCNLEANSLQFARCL